VLRNTSRGPRRAGAVLHVQGHKGKSLPSKVSAQQPYIRLRVARQSLICTPQAPHCDHVIKPSTRGATPSLIDDLSAQHRLPLRCLDALKATDTKKYVQPLVHDKHVRLHVPPRRLQQRGPYTPRGPVWCFRLYIAGSMDLSAGVFCTSASHGCARRCTDQACSRSRSWSKTTGKEALKAYRCNSWSFGLLGTSRIASVEPTWHLHLHCHSDYS
jgi:hypothetical protein